MNLLPAQQLERIEAHLRRLLDRVLNAPGLADLNAMIRDYVLGGGKRIRPQLCVWTFQNAGGTSIDDSILDLACAWELFHAFLLCHDDIIDGADTRRDLPSLHRSLAMLDSNSPRFGMNLGIVAGDLLFSAALRLLHELDLPATTYRDELKLFSRIACITGFGQAIDICQSHAPIDSVSEELLLREYHWKTAAYTFEGPMLAGAIAADVTDGAVAAISRYALALGQAYQLQNDLIDLATEAHAGSDLVEGKRTITLVRARVAMSPPKRLELDQQLDAIARSDQRKIALAESLRIDLLSGGAADRTRELIDEFLDTASNAATDRSLPAPLSQSLGTLLESLRDAYFSVACA